MTERKEHGQEWYYLDVNHLRHFLIFDIEREKGVPFLIRGWKEVIVHNFHCSSDHMCIIAVDPFPLQVHDFEEELPVWYQA